MNNVQMSIDLSYENANEVWKREAKAAVHILIRRGEDFSVDQVVELLDRLGVTTRNMSALGAIMQKFSRDGYIRFIRYTPSQRASRHSSVVRVWRPVKRLARV